MANIFAILTAIVLAVSAFLAYQNKGRPEEAGRGYAGWLKKAKDEKDALVRKQGQLAATQTELNDTNTELADYNDRNTKLDEELKTQLATNEDLDKQVTAKQGEASAKAEEVTSKKKSLEDLGDIDDVLASLKQTESEIAQLNLDIAQGEAQQAALEAQRVSVDAALGNVREKIKWRSTGTSDPSLNTTVRNVYRNLGFVTLAGGDNLGIVKDSSLEVVRDGAVIAKLQVTTVEASTAAADIVPESLAEGESVQAGDRVRSPAAAAPAPAPAAPAPAAPAPEAAPAVNPEPQDPDALPETDPAEVPMEEESVFD